MSRFKFRLQPVLDQRIREEREKQLVVVELERTRLALESRIRMCQQMINDERATLCEELGTGQRVNLQEVKMQAGATLTHNFNAQRTVLELAGVFKKLQNARLELAEAAARRKAVELLKTQQFDAFKRELDLKESRDLDEMSVMRVNRHDWISI